MPRVHLRIDGEVEDEAEFDTKLVVGRSSDSDLRIPRDWVSRQHVSIFEKDGEYFVQDLDTRNGTCVNGCEITRVKLHHGDMIEIGPCELTFELDEDFFSRGGLDDYDANTTISGTVNMSEMAVGLAEESTPHIVENLRTRLEALREMSETACGELEMEPLLRRIMRRLLEVYPQAEHVHSLLFDLDEDEDDLRLTLARSKRSDEDSGMSRTLLRIATEELQAVLASDVLTDQRLEPAMSLHDAGLRSVMCCPLIVRDKLLGAIQVDTSDASRKFTMDDLELLATACGQVAIAAENARLYRRAVQRERLAAIGQAVSGVAHCIKNVLNCAKGGAYILELGLKKDDDEKIAKGWDIVQRNTDFMTDLVRDMLTYCRKERGEREPTDLSEVMRGLLEMVQDSAEQEDVTISLEFDDQIPELMLNAVNIKRAVLNLVTNAIEACSEGGNVGIAVKLQEGQEIVILVKDDGSGIPEDVQKRLFEPFFTTKGSRGTGLGLPLVKKVIEEHDGRVKVESESGIGTSFQLTLPVTAANQDET
ncbi:MAG: FHA domain-containing protein [Planctomycetes bacterium]|nr:FHA domain-containing protein [Planctomycetota bacterium]